MKLEDLTKEQQEQIALSVAEFTPQQIRDIQKELKQFDEGKTKVFGNLFSILICFVVAYFIKYDPNVEYTWLYGWVLHSWLTIPKLIFSLFTDTISAKPALYTTGYIVWWWITLVANAYAYLSTLIRLFVYLKNRKTESKGQLLLAVIQKFYPEKMAEAAQIEEKTEGGE